MPDAFSRSGNGSPLGKRTRLVRTTVSEATGEGLEKLWRSAGYASESEYLAVLIDVHVFGEERIAKLHADRVRAAARKGHQSSRN